jgi:hypothetical protein
LFRNCTVRYSKYTGKQWYQKVRLREVPSSEVAWNATAVPTAEIVAPVTAAALVNKP